MGRPMRMGLSYIRIIYIMEPNLSIETPNWLKLRVLARHKQQ